MKRKIRRFTGKSILYAMMTVHEVRAIEAYLRGGGSPEGNDDLAAERIEGSSGQGVRSGMA